MLDKDPSSVSTTNAEQQEEKTLDDTQEESSIDNNNKKREAIEKSLKTTAESIAAEREKTAAILTSRNTDTTSGNITTTKTKENRLSKESGIGSSVSSQLDDDKDAEDDSEEISSNYNESIDKNSQQISPRSSQLLEGLEDQYYKVTHEREQTLGIIAEEEETKSTKSITSTTGTIINISGQNQQSSSSSQQSQLPATITSPPPAPSSQQQPRIGNLKSFEPDSRSIKSIDRHSTGRLSTGRLSLDRISLDRLSTETGNSININETDSNTSAERKLSRSKFSSLSIRNRTRTMFVASSNNHNDETFGKQRQLTKVGKVLGMTPDEEKILVGTPSSTSIGGVGISSKASKILGLSSSPPSTDIIPDRERPPTTISSSAKANKVLGIPPLEDHRPFLDKSNKANRILGISEGDSHKRAASLHVERVTDKVLSEFVGPRSSTPSFSGTITVATIRNHISQNGYMARYMYPSFSFSKSWKRRYFALAKGTLYCFKSSDSIAPMIDNFEITANTIVCVTENFSNKPWVLEVSKPGEKKWYLQADNVEDMKGWLSELKSTVTKCKYSTQMLPDVPTNITNTAINASVSSNIFDQDEKSIVSTTLMKSSTTSTINNNHPTQFHNRHPYTHHGSASVSGISSSSTRMHNSTSSPILSAVRTHSKRSESLNSYIDESKLSYTLSSLPTYHQPPRVSASAPPSPTYTQSLSHKASPSDDENHHPPQSPSVKMIGLSELGVPSRPSSPIEMQRIKNQHQKRSMSQSENVTSPIPIKQKVTKHRPTLSGISATGRPRSSSLNSINSVATALSPQHQSPPSPTKKIILPPPYPKPDKRTVMSSSNNNDAGMSSSWSQRSPGFPMPPPRTVPPEFHVENRRRPPPPNIPLHQRRPTSPMSAPTSPV
ncbi:13011_t:CDS:2, partial [Ambispora leptoticha]